MNKTKILLHKNITLLYIYFPLHIKASEGVTGREYARAEKVAEGTTVCGAGLQVDTNI